MTRRDMFALGLATGALLCLAVAVADAQTTPIQRAVKVARDSILCTTSASKQQQRACARLDSVITTPVTAPVVCALPTCNPGSPGNTGYAVLVFSSLDESDTGDSTFCARLERMDGKVFVGYWPIWRQPLGDSAAFVPRSGDATMQQKCGGAFQRAGYPLPTDSIEIVWKGLWVTVNGKRSWRPVAGVR